MEILDNIKFWIIIFCVIILLIPLTIWYFIYVNVLHKKLADEEEWFYDY